MSSRNAYLTRDERACAAEVSRTMRDSAAAIEAGQPIRTVVNAAAARLVASGYSSVDYVEARRADTLAPFGADTAPPGVGGRILIAARLGKTRLIDNMAFVRK